MESLKNLKKYSKVTTCLLSYIVLVFALWWHSYGMRFRNALQWHSLNHSLHSVRQLIYVCSIYPCVGSQKLSALYTSSLRHLQRLKAVMEQRAKAFVNYRHYIALRAKFYFQMMLSQRGYNGKMVFDHDGEGLKLQVRPIRWLLSNACSFLFHLKSLHIQR